MKPELTIIPSLSIHPNKIVTYNQVIWEHGRPARKYFGTGLEFLRNDPNDTERRNLSQAERILESDRKAHGLISDNAKRKLLKAIDYLLLVSNPKSVTTRLTGRKLAFKIAFITLTLPGKQFHSDKEIKNQALNQFLIEISRYHKVKHYVWRSERQKNGNVHFHILIDTFIDWNDIRNRWNRIIGKMGYIKKYREEQQNWHKDGFRLRPELLQTWPKEKQYEAWKRGAKHNWDNPNSTDIHSIRKINNIRQYVVKYMAKNELENEETQNNEETEIYESGRIWSCSQVLSNITGARSDIDQKIESELKAIEETEEIKRYKDTYFSVYFVNFEDLSALRGQYLFRLFCAYLIKKFGYHYQTSTG